MTKEGKQIDPFYYFGTNKFLFSFYSNTKQKNLAHFDILMFVNLFLEMWRMTTVLLLFIITSIHCCPVLRAIFIALWIFPLSFQMHSWWSWRWWWEFDVWVHSNITFDNNHNEENLLHHIWVMCIVQKCCSVMINWIMSI